MPKQSTKEKTVKINAEPYHAEIRRYEGGFEWTFYARTRFGTRKVFRFKFPRWWLCYLAKDIKKVLEEEKKEISHLENLVYRKPE